MKKLFFFAILALLIGGFTSNASAQDKVKKTEKTEASKQVSWDNVIKEYELIVDKCVKLYKEQNADNSNIKGTSDFDKCLTKALDMKKKIEGAKDSLTRSQVRRYNEATKKLNKLIIK